MTNQMSVLTFLTQDRNPRVFNFSCRKYIILSICYTLYKWEPHQRTLLSNIYLNWWSQFYEPNDPNSCNQWIGGLVWDLVSLSTEVRWRTTTSGWRLTSTCTVPTDKTIRPTSFQWWNLCTTTTTTPWLMQPHSLWTMDIIQHSWMSWQWASQDPPMSMFSRSMRFKQNASGWSNGHRRYWRRHMIDGEERTPALR